MLEQHLKLLSQLPRVWVGSKMLKLSTSAKILFTFVLISHLLINLVSNSGI